MTFQLDSPYNELLEEIWMGNTSFGQTIYVKVLQTTDNKMVIVTWEYQNYKFSIQGSVAGI